MYVAYIYIFNIIWPVMFDFGFQDRNCKLIKNITVGSVLLVWIGFNQLFQFLSSFASL